MGPPRLGSQVGYWVQYKLISVEVEMRTIEISSPSFRIHRGRLDNVMKIYISKRLPKFLSKNIFKNFGKNRKIFSFSRFRKSEKSKKNRTFSKSEKSGKSENLEFFRFRKFRFFPIFPISKNFDFFRFFRFPKSGKWKYFPIFFKIFENVFW